MASGFFTLNSKVVFCLKKIKKILFLHFNGKKKIYRYILGVFRLMDSKHEYLYVQLLILIEENHPPFSIMLSKTWCHSVAFDFECI